MESPPWKPYRDDVRGTAAGAREASAGDEESLESAVVQNSFDVEDGEEVVRSACCTPVAIVRGFNMQGGVLGKQAQMLLQALVVPANQGAVMTKFQMPERECVSECSVADDESSDSDESERGGLDRSLEGWKSVFPRKVVLKRQHSAFKRRAEAMNDYDEVLTNAYAQVSSTAGVRSVSKVRGGLKKRKHEEYRPVYETEQSDESASSSDSGSSSSESEQEVTNMKRRKGEHMDGNITWTDELVKFLFHTHDAVHLRLAEQNRGQYERKWAYIVEVMQERFGQRFTRKQLQRKYRCVQRECSDYRCTSSKIAPNGSVVGKELLKPEFYDIWSHASRRNQSLQSPDGAKKLSTKHLEEDCVGEIKEMQQLMEMQLHASEKRESGLKRRAELMMDLLTHHMEHVEKRVCSIEEGGQPQVYLLEQINNKLEKVLDGFSALNENLSIISACISSNLDS